MLNNSCMKFLEDLSSNSPVPGGGGAAAFCGAQGIALGMMVGNLTIGKKKYAEVQEEIKLLLVKLQSLQNELIDLIQKDAEVFEPLSKAYGLPTSTKEETEHKNKVMEEILIQATIVPINIMKKAMDGLILLEKIEKIGTRIALSDVAVGSELLKASVYSGAMNVYINTKYMKDKTFAQSCEKEADELKKRAKELSEQIYSAVEEELRH